MLWVGRGLKAHLGHLPLSQVAPSLVQPGLGHFQGCGNALAQGAQSSCGCPWIPGSAQGQAGQGLEQPGMVKGVGQGKGAAGPALGRRGSCPLFLQEETSCRQGVGECQSPWPLEGCLRHKPEPQPASAMCSTLKIAVVREEMQKFGQTPHKQGMERAAVLPQLQRTGWGGRDLESSSLHCHAGGVLQQHQFPAGSQPGSLPSPGGHGQGSSALMWFGTAPAVPGESQAVGRAVPHALRKFGHWERKGSRSGGHGLCGAVWSVEGLGLVSGHDPNELFCRRQLDEEGWAEVRKKLREFTLNTQVKAKLISHPQAEMCCLSSCPGAAPGCRGKLPWIERDTQGSSRTAPGLHRHPNNPTLGIPRNTPGLCPFPGDRSPWSLAVALASALQAMLAGFTVPVTTARTAAPCHSCPRIRTTFWHLCNKLELVAALCWHCWAISSPGGRHGGAAGGPGKGIEMGKGLEHQEGLRELGGGPQPGEKEARGDLVALHNSLMEGTAGGVLSSAPREQGQEEREQLQAAQSSDGVTTPEGIYKTCGCGTWGHGLVVALAVPG
ncbi:hypothetical protein DV515_00016458 [Chloebia gouldiae]|uniref:Uncharacterized protein n=1 Tax=Chloebia gouldiae TaxID=44316 RepID=A0A3L8RTU2_CHLGU|nr:hypothetical protein DV515_00016458 [Chloebia gouldiae]